MDWDIYNRAEADGTSTGSTENIYSSDIDIKIEITAVDKQMVEQSFTGTHVAGDKVEYDFNRYGQLNCTVGGYKAKGSMFKGILSELSGGNKYFKATEEIGLSNQWTILKGSLFPNGSNIQGGFLCRGETIIGFYKKGNNVANTIMWYEKMVYKSNAWQNMRTHSLRDFKPEFHTEDDLYATQAPEFTREDELEEIYQFIASLRARKRSAQEQQILEDIKVELDSMV